MTNIDLLKRAEIDLKTAYKMLEETSDELFLDICAYHLHQAIEKGIKYSISTSGEEYSYTHDIFKLLEICDKYDIEYPDWIYKNGNVLNDYGTKTRYGTDLTANRRKVTELLALCEQYLNSIKILEDEHCDYKFKKFEQR